MKRTTPRLQRLCEAQPLMAGPLSRVEFQQRLQWLSEGMLANHLVHQDTRSPSPEEIAAYRQYKDDQP